MIYNIKHITTKFKFTTRSGKFRLMLKYCDTNKCRLYRTIYSRWVKQTLTLNKPAIEDHWSYFNGNNDRFIAAFIIIKDVCVHTILHSIVFW